MTEACRERTKRKCPAPQAGHLINRSKSRRKQDAFAGIPHRLRKSAEREAPNRQVFWLCFTIRFPSRPWASGYKADSTSQRRHRTGFTPVSLFSRSSVRAPERLFDCGKYITPFSVCQERERCENGKKNSLTGGILGVILAGELNRLQEPCVSVQKRGEDRQSGERPERYRRCKR